MSKDIKIIIKYYLISAVSYLALFFLLNLSEYLADFGLAPIIIFLILLVVVTFGIGYFSGRTPSMFKWSIPIYTGLLIFCLPYIMFGYDDDIGILYFLVFLITFGISLAGVGTGDGSYIRKKAEGNVDN